jgi:hypothetical protein
VTVVDTPNYATVSPTGGPGFRLGPASRGTGAASPAGSFLSLLLQDQPALPAGAASDKLLGQNTSLGGDPPTIATKTFSSLLHPTSAAPETTSKRKKTSKDTDAGPLVLVTPAPDPSKAAHWFLSLTSGQASDACPPPSASSDLDAQYAVPSAGSRGEVLAAAGSAQEDKAQAVPELPAEAIQGGDSLTDRVISGVTQGATNAAPFAELALTPAATPNTAIRVTADRVSAFSTLSLETATAPARAVPEIDSQPQHGADSPATPEIDMKNPAQGSGAALDLFSNGQNGTLVVPKKKADGGSAQAGDDAIPSNRRGNDWGIAQRAITPAAAPLATESQRTSSTAEPPPATSTVTEPPNTEGAKSAGSSVDAIELQVKSTNDSSVGLRFVERQGHIEIQLKSGDPQTAQALSENLAGLKTSLSETGWDVQTRLPSAGQTAQGAALDQRIHAAADPSGSSQSPRTGEVTAGQMNQQSGSDSTAGQDHPRPARDDSSGRNAQQGRHDGASADSERQGRRSARDSEAWLESIQSNLTRSSAGSVTTGVTE